MNANNWNYPTLEFVGEDQNPNFNGICYIFIEVGTLNEHEYRDKRNNLARDFHPFVPGTIYTVNQVRLYTGDT